MSTIDTMSFDGSCDRNPGGRMGWAYVITFADGRIIQKGDERAPRPENTVNVAEYHGIIAGLRAYIEAGGTGPLRITGDSQLVIYQLSGTYKVRTPALQPLHAEATALRSKLLRSEVVWRSREHNAAADRLAAGESAQAAANVLAAGDTVLRDELQATLPPALAQSIAQLNANVAPGFKHFAALRTGGLDAFSKLALPALKTRAGAAAATQIGEALPDEKMQAAALRWALRGLGVGRAVRKVQVDADVQAGAQRARR